MSYKPKIPFNVPMKVLIPEWKTINGVRKKVYPSVDESSDDLIFFGAFRTFGGTETNTNEVYGVEKTAVIETWFRPEIQADCRIVLLNSDKAFDILGEPENIEMRNQFLKFKVKAVGGKA